MKSFLKGIGVGVLGTAIAGSLASGAYFFGKHSATNEDVIKALNTPVPTATYQLKAMPTYPISVTPASPTPKAVSTPTPAVAKLKERIPVPYKKLNHSNVAEKYLSFFHRIHTEAVNTGQAKLAGIEGDFTNDGLPDAFVVSYNSYTGVTYLGLENTGIGYKIVYPQTTRAWFSPDNSHELKNYFETQSVYSSNFSWAGRTDISDIYPVFLDGNLPKIVMEIINKSGNDITKRYVIHPFVSKGNVQIILNEPLLSKPLLWDLDGDGNNDFVIMRYSGDSITVYKSLGTLWERNKSIEDKTRSALKDTSKILRRGLSKEETLAQLEDIWNYYDSRTVISTFYILGGEGFMNRLPQLPAGDDLPEFVKRASEQLRQEGWSILLEDLPRGDYATIARRLMNAYLITEAAKKSVTGTTAYGSTGPGRIQETQFGFIAYEGGQAYSFFRTREEAEQFLKREQLSRKNEPTWRDVWTETDTHTGTTTTISSWVTEEESKKMRMQKEIEAGIRKEKERLGFSPAEEAAKAKNLLSDLLSKK